MSLFEPISEETYQDAFREEHVQTYPCKYCGHCPYPEQCVRSVECPYCLAFRGSGCVTAIHSQFPTGYHEQRWEIVRQRFGHDYRR